MLHLQRSKLRSVQIKLYEFNLSGLTFDSTKDIIPPPQIVFMIPLPWAFVITLMRWLPHFEASHRCSLVCNWILVLVRMSHLRQQPVKMSPSFVRWAIVYVIIRLVCIWVLVLVRMSHPSATTVWPFTENLNWTIGFEVCTHAKAQKIKKKP